MLYGYLIIICLIILLIGYSIGRRIGIKEGEERTTKQLAIQLKLDYFKSKKCPICLNNASETDIENP